MLELNGTNKGASEETNICYQEPRRGERERLRKTDSRPRSVSLAMRRHHDQGNSYLGKHVVVSLLTDSP